MPSTQDPEEYREKWKTHTQLIKRIGFNLDEKEDRKRLQEIEEELNELINKASKNI